MKGVGSNLHVRVVAGGGDELLAVLVGTRLKTYGLDHGDVVTFDAGFGVLETPPAIILHPFDHVLESSATRYDVIDGFSDEQGRAIALWIRG